MDLNYQVPREEYIQLLEDMIRRNEHRPLRRFTFLLLTVVQMVVVFLLSILYLQGSQRVFFMVWSLLLAGIIVLRRRSFHARAKGTLTRLEYNNQLPADYWKEHKLRVVKGEYHLSYGDQRLSCSLSSVSRVDERAHALHVYCGDAIFDIIPEDAFRSHEAMLDYAARLRETAAQTPAPPKPEHRLQGGVSWQMAEEDFYDAQFITYQKLYYRYRFLRPATFVRLAICVCAMINLLHDPHGLNLALSILLMVLANLENISMIPFVCRKRIDREVGEWRGSTEFRLALEGGTLFYASDRAEINIPFEKLNLCEEIGPYFIIAWGRFPAVVLPRDVCRDGEAAAMVEVIRSRYEAAQGAK